MHQPFPRPERTTRARGIARLRRNVTAPLTESYLSPGGEPLDPLLCEHPQQTFMPMFAACDYVTGENYVVGYCNLCKLHVTTPVPSPEQLAKYYPAGYYGAGEGRRFAGLVEWLLDRLYSFRALFAEGRQKPGKVLDIGCGRGLLLDKLRQRGWEPYGTELSDAAASYARERLGLTVYTEPLQDIGFPDNEFDMVILWHVLEHVPSPRTLLKEVARILKPGGTLLVAVPNFGSWEARWGRSGWFHLDVPRHLTHFTPRTLRAVLDAAGLAVREVNFFSVEYDFFSFVQTAQNRLGLPHNLLYNLLRTRSARLGNRAGRGDSGQKGPAWGAIALALISAVPLGLISLIYMPLVAALGRGATIAAYAVKRMPSQGPTPGTGGPFSGNQ